MFERYTEKARRVIFFSRYEASQFGSPYIESEHLLLGLLRESKAISSKLALSSSLTVDNIRKDIERHTPVREGLSTSVDLPLSKECQNILRHSGEEADRLGHKHIGTEHILVGILLEQDCYAARLLREHGVSLETVRSEIGEEPTRELAQPKSPGIPTGYRWKNLLYNPASESVVIEMTRTDTGHLPMSRLFTRHIGGEFYEQIGNPPDDVSYESPITCESQPIVIFNSVKWAGGGGHPDGVYSFDLRTKELSVCIPKDSLIIPEPHLRSWILTLVSLSEDGETLYLKIGIEKSVSEGGVVHYYLASLTLGDKRLKLLSVLKDIRF